MAKGFFTGLDYGWTVVNLLAVINLLFEPFYLLQGTGVATVLISALVLLLNNTRSVRGWYGTT